MTELSQATRQEYIDHALRRKFDSVLDWKKPEFGYCVGPSDYQAFDEYEKRVACLIKLATEILEGLTDKHLHLAAFKNPKKDDQNTFGDWWSIQLAGEVSSLRRQMPKAISAGFGHPKFRPDFIYWGQMEDLDMFEALALSVGVEPARFRSDYYEGIEKNLRLGKAIWPASEFLDKRRKLFERRFGTRHQRASITHEELKDWFDRIELEVHPEFYAQLERRVRGRFGQLGRQPINETIATSKAPDRRELESVAQLLTAMAIDGYGYDPKAKRSSIPKEIQGVADSMGLSLTDETIRKYLKLGNKFISDDWEPPVS